MTLRKIATEAAYIIVSLALVLGIAQATGCQWAARRVGVTTTVKVPEGRQVITCSWKDNNLWILTRARADGESPRTLQYIESSSLGMLEGKVVLQEQ